MELIITPKRLVQFFAAMAVCLTFAHVSVQTVRFVTGHDALLGLVALFSLGSDVSLAAFYSSFAILFCSVLSALIGVAGWREAHSQAPYWLGLAAIFLFLSVDEMLGLHEHLNDLIRSALGSGGFFYYAWVIPYGAALSIFLAVYFRFLIRLPLRTAVLSVVAGATFVGGAVGAEMIGGWYSEAHGNDNVTYVALQTIEELLEMAGIVILIFALAEYIHLRFGEVGVRISESGSAVTGLKERNNAPRKP